MSEMDNQVIAYTPDLPDSPLLHLSIRANFHPHQTRIALTNPSFFEQ